MSDQDRSAHPDSLPEADHDTRSDIEQAVASRSDEVERAGTDVGRTSALDSTVSIDGAGGAGGIVKNQEDAQQ